MRDDGGRLRAWTILLARAMSGGRYGRNRRRRGRVGTCTRRVAVRPRGVPVPQLCAARRRDVAGALYGFRLLSPTTRSPTPTGTETLGAGRGGRDPAAPGPGRGAPARLPAARTDPRPAFRGRGAARRGA